MKNLQQIPKGQHVPGLKFEHLPWMTQEIEQHGGVVTVRKSSALGKSEVLARHVSAYAADPRRWPKPKAPKLKPLAVATAEAWAPKTLPKGNPKV